MADIWPIKVELDWFGRYIGRYMADKSQVLNLLHARGDGWTSRAQIRATIDVPDRTLRNWLKDLVEEGAIEARGERKGRRYRLVERSAGVEDRKSTRLNSS